MAGHNKWVQIKRKKAVTDAEKSKLYGKLGRLISLESKRCGGQVSTPSLARAIEQAKVQNVPKDIIERAVRRGTESSAGALERVTYEAYGPGGVGFIIEGLTDNRNRASAEIKHTLSKYGASLGAMNSVSWAFQKSEDQWLPQVPVAVDTSLSEEVGNLAQALEELEDVEAVYNNAQTPES